MAETTKVRIRATRKFYIGAEIAKAGETYSVDPLVAREVVPHKATFVTDAETAKELISKAAQAETQRVMAAAGPVRLYPRW